MKKGVKKVGWVDPWIRENEILELPDIEDGEMCDVVDFSNNYVGRGYVNRNSFITIRLLTHSPEKIDKEFLKKRIRKAFETRRKSFQGAFRLIHSEADNLPGLTADYFDGYLVVQVNTLGIERIKEDLFDALEEVTEARGIFEKSDTPARKREGLKDSIGWVRGKGGEFIPFEMEDVAYFSDLKGQKTGFFLDQRFNARAVRNFSTGSVLDVFCYTGNFTLNAFKGGAEEVISVDSSSRAKTVYEKHLALNNVRSGYEFIVGNAFDELRRFEKSGRKFDTVILDPPAFAKSRKHLSSALRGYKEINLRAMKLLKDGGYLATASCSAALSRETFLKVIEGAARDAHKMLKCVYFGIQSYDHPTVIGIKESEYLKFFVFEVEAIS